jgi:hypothetical protein
MKVDERPIINKHYVLTFREIDNFDTLLGLLAWRPRLRSQEMFFLVHCIRMTVVNIITSWLDLNHQENTVPAPPDMVNQARAIADVLLANK